MFSISSLKNNTSIMAQFKNQHSSDYSDFRNYFPASTIVKTNQSKSSDNMWESQIKPKLDSMNVDDEYRAWTEEQLKNMDPDVAIKVLANMEKYVDLPTQSIGDAKQFHLGDHESYINWSTELEQNLESWLQSDAPDISPSVREQAGLALDMLRQLSSERAGAALTTEDIIASGNYYNGDHEKLDKVGADEAFNAALFKRLGIENVDDSAELFNMIFSKDGGAADFVKSVYQARFDVGIAIDGNNSESYISGIPNKKPGEGLPYGCILNEDTGDLEGPFYSAGYPAFQAAVLETMGIDFKLDHNNVPIATSDKCWGTGAAEIYTLEDGSWVRSEIDLEKELGLKPSYLNHDDGMENYSLLTNWEALNASNKALRAFLESIQGKEYSDNSIEYFTKEIENYLGNTFKVNDDHDVFAYNKGRNYNSKSSYLNYLNRAQSVPFV